MKPTAPLRVYAKAEPDVRRQQLLYSIVFASEELAACQKRIREIHGCIDHWLAELATTTPTPEAPAGDSPDDQLLRRSNSYIGLAARVAKQLGVARSTVRRVATGHMRSERIRLALLAEIRKVEAGGACSDEVAQ